MRIAGGKESGVEDKYQPVINRDVDRVGSAYTAHFAIQNADKNSISTELSEKLPKSEHEPDKDQDENRLGRAHVAHPQAI